MSEKLITESIVQHSKVLKSLDQDTIGKAAQLIVESIHNNGKIFWCGNGGSASQANHLSAELVGGMYQKKTKNLILLFIKNLILIFSQNFYHLLMYSTV